MRKAYGSVSYPTCFEDLQEGDVVRDCNLYLGGDVYRIQDDRVFCKWGKSHRYEISRDRLEFFGLAGDSPEWVRAGALDFTTP